MSNTGLTIWRQSGATLSKKAGDVAVIKVDDLYHIIDIETGEIIGGNILTLRDALRDIPWAKNELKLMCIPKYKDAVKKKKKRRRRKKKQDGRIPQKRKARGKKVLDIDAGSVPDWRTAAVARKRKRRGVGYVGGIGVTRKDLSYSSVPLLEARSGGGVVLLVTNTNLKRGCPK